MMIASVKEGMTQARSKAQMVAAHGQDVLRTGVQGVQEVQAVIVGARREAVELMVRTRDELQRTMREGVSRVGDRLSRIATPTHREEALAQKAAVKAKKQRKRQAEQEGDAPDA